MSGLGGIHEGLHSLRAEGEKGRDRGGGPGGRTAVRIYSEFKKEEKRDFLLPQTGTDKRPPATRYMERALGTRALSGVSHQILSLGGQGTPQEGGGKSVRTRGDRGHQEDKSFKTNSRGSQRLKSKHRAS